MTRQYLPDRTLQAIRQRFDVSEGEPVEYRGPYGYLHYGRTVMLTPKPSRFTEIRPRNQNVINPRPLHQSGPPRPLETHTEWGLERK